MRTPVDQIPLIGRNTQGVRLIRLDEGERLVELARVEKLQGEDEDLDDDSESEDDESTQNTIDNGDPE